MRSRRACCWRPVSSAAVLGVPIGFVLAFSALLYFLADPTLPLLVYSQQVMAGADHFVLLAVPFFVLAGLLMESNGMSARLVELLLRIFGRVRGGRSDRDSRDGLLFRRVEPSSPTSRQSAAS